MYRLMTLADENWKAAVVRQDYHGAAIWRGVRAAIENLGEIEPADATAWFDRFLLDLRGFTKLVDELRPPPT